MSTPRDARSLAVDVLVRVEAGAYANLLLPRALRGSGLALRDRAFATDLVYGTLRMRGLVDSLLARVLHRPLGALDPPVRAALRLGAYQLYAGVAAHAAVGETVEAIGTRVPRAKGLVNGALRTLATQGPPFELPEGDDPAAVATRTSHPRWIVEVLRDTFGHDDAAAILATDNEAPVVTLRPRGDRTALVDELVSLGVRVMPPRLVSSAVVVAGTGDPATLAPVRAGRATPQDEASQAVALAVDAAPGERVLDLAAAPGGKATALAERGAEVVASEVREARARLAEAAARLELGRVQVVVADGRQLPFVDRPFDRVLVDAPCSGLGVLRRRPDTRWRVEPRDIEPLAALQRDLLGAACAVVRPGGCVVYSVCTLTDAETRGVDRWARDALPRAVALPILPPPWRPWGRGAILLPSDAGTDGMYVLRLTVGGAPSDGR